MVRLTAPFYLFSFLALSVVASPIARDVPTVKQDITDVLTDVTALASAIKGFGGNPLNAGVSFGF